jgi:hypothetical protein
VVVDDTNPDACDLQERLFAISDFDRMEMLNEMSGLPPEVLATHPELMTWEDIRFRTTADPPPLPPRLPPLPATTGSRRPEEKPQSQLPRGRRRHLLTFARKQQPQQRQRPRLRWR